jgi:hypothetical protein
MHAYQRKHQPARHGKPAVLARPGAAARQVHSILHSPLQRKCACGGTCQECQNPAPPSVHEVLRSSGQPLDPETRGFMELRFGQDFSRVRVHTDGRAAESARAVDARAYTVRRDIAFGKGQYAPGTPGGRRLLAHELTHVLHQTGGAKGAPGLQRSVVTSGCDKLPYDKKRVEESAGRIYDHVKTSGCIPNESLRNDVLDKLGSLKIKCQSGGSEGPCARAEKPRTIYLYEALNKPSLCPDPMDAAVFHEVIHLTESFSMSHGSLSWDCGEACYPGADEKKRGDASKCGFERNALPLLSVSAGGALSSKGTTAKHYRLYVGLDKRRLILSSVDLLTGVGVSFVGIPDKGEPGNAPSGTSGLAALIGALRFDPGKMGGRYLSVSAGAGLAFGNDEKSLGLVAGIGGGYRFHMFDIAANVGVDYNPTRNLGDKTMFTFSASFSFAQKVRP